LGSPRPTARALTAAVVALAVAAAASLFLGDFDLDQANLDFRASAARTALRALPPWPEPAHLAGRIAFFHFLATRSPALRRETLTRHEQAVARDRTDPAGWTVLGQAQFYFGEVRAAERDFRQALRWDPWSLNALNELGRASLSAGDRAVARMAFRRSLSIRPNQVRVRRLLADLARS